MASVCYKAWDYTPMKASRWLGAALLLLSTIRYPASVRRLPDYGRGRQLSRLCRSLLVTRLPRRSQAKAGHWSLATVCALLISAANLFAQGSLTPPGAPAPTMKSLDQIASTGVAINATNTPGDANTHFIISQSGSYFLTGNLAATKTTGIRVNAAGVTIDLNGFQISRSSGGGGDGIFITTISHRSTVRNGSVTDFAQGINCQTTAARGCVFRDLVAANCTNIAIRAGEGAVLESCRVHDNSGVAGILTANAGTLLNCTAVGNSASNAIQAGAGSTLSNCAASSNTGTNAFSAGDGSSLTNCAATGNTLTGSAILAGSACPLNNCAAFNNTATYGIQVGSGSSLANCTAGSNAAVTYGLYADTGSSITNCSTYSNSVSQILNSAGIGTGVGSVISNSTSYSNSSPVPPPLGNRQGMGFSVGDRSTIQNSTARSNGGNGIYLSGDAAARGNNSVGNGLTSAPSGAGIHAIGSYNCVEGNNLVGNQYGVEVLGNHNIILNNTASSNPSDSYFISGGNSYGVIVDDNGGGGAAVSGSSAAATFGSPNAWANFTY
jgi:parallel beta-helix repeat protein